MAPAFAPSSGLQAIHRDTICRLVVRFGDACRVFLDRQMHDLEPDKSKSCASA